MGRVANDTSFNLQSLRSYRSKQPYLIPWLIDRNSDIFSNTRLLLQALNVKRMCCSL